MSGDVAGNTFWAYKKWEAIYIGPKLKEDVESSIPSNVTLTCSTSGKLSTSLSECFVENR